MKLFKLKNTFSIYHEHNWYPGRTVQVVDENHNHLYVKQKQYCPFCYRGYRTIYI